MKHHHKIILIIITYTENIHKQGLLVLWWSKHVFRNTCK